MKKFAIKQLFLLLSILTLTLFTACSNQERQVVSTDGSTSMGNLISAIGEAFENSNDIGFTYNPTGSSSGITAVAEGRADIGLSSRALKKAELEKNLEEKVLALDGIVVIVHRDNPLNNLSVDELFKIYSGEIKNWKDLGGEDKEIIPIGREAGSGTRDAFEIFANLKDKARYRQELTSTGDVLATVRANVQAIGYASLSALRDDVKPVSIDGIAATEDNIRNSTYAFVRPFVLVTKKDEKLSEAARKFYDFATSEAVHELIRKAGLIIPDK